MRRMTIHLVCTVIILTLVFPLQIQASPGGGLLKTFVSVVSGVSKLKQRQNAYRTADKWLNEAYATNEENYQDITENQFEMNVSDYNNRLLLIERQDRDIQELHQRLKKHAHDDFQRFARSEALNLLFAKLSKSASFNKKLGRFHSFITDADNNMSEAIAKLAKAEKLFWPDKLKQAHETIKASREALKALDLIGASPAKLKQMLETLDTKLDKLKESTEPKTLAKIRKELEAAQEEIGMIAQKTATIVEKVSKTEALATYVSKSAVDDPKVKKLIADISKREGEITAAYARQAFGPETMDRLKELGIDPDRGDIEQVQKLYVQKLIALKKTKAGLTPSELDKLWLEAAKEVTPVEGYAKTAAVIKANKDKGVKPLEVSFSYDGKKEEGLSYEWEIDDTQASSAASFSYTFEEVGEYEVSLTVTTKRGVSDKAKKTITVTEPVTFSIKISPEPKEVGRGGTVIITASPVINGVEEGKLDMAITVDGKTIFSDTTTGVVGYDSIGKYNVAKDEAYGKKTVLAKGTLTLDEAMAKAYGKDSVTAQAEGAFEVKEGIFNSDLFIGTWKCIMQFVSHSAATKEDLANIPKQAAFTLIISKEGDEFTAQLPEAKTKRSGQSETIFRIETVHPDGNRMTIRAEEEDWVIANGIRGIYSRTYHNIELTVSDDGSKLNGTEELYIHQGESKDYDTQVNKITGTRSK